MKVQYRTTFYDGSTVGRHEIVSIDACCSNIQEIYEAFNHDSLILDEEARMSLAIANNMDDYDSSPTVNYRIIIFCPFCGTRIVCEEVEKVAITTKRSPHVVTHTEYRTSQTAEVIWRKGQVKA